MKKLLYFFIAFLLNCPILFAQFEIDSSFAPFPGNAEKIWYVDAKSLSPGSSGENQNWNFTDLNLLGDSSVTIYTIASSTPYSKDFPLANVASYTLNYPSYIYYKISSNSYESMGNGQKIGVIVYSKPQILMQYPFLFNKSFTSNFAGSGTSSGYKLNVCGTFSVTCDAFGTISLPSGKSEVIRIKSICTFYDTLYFENSQINTNYYISTTYNWYKKNYKFSIFFFDKSVSNGTTTLSAGYVKNSSTIDNNQLEKESY